MKIKKIIALGLIAAMTASMLTGCGKKDEEKEPEAETATEAPSDQTENNGDDADTPSADTTVDMTGVTLLNDGVLTVGAEIGYPPFESYADDGTTPIGYDVDLANAIGKKMGVDVKFIDTAFDGILGGIGVNYDVVISAVTINDERKESVDFSTPYISNYQSVVVPKGSDIKVESFNDLDGKIIAFQKGTTSDELLTDYKETGSIDCTLLANEKMLQCFTQMDNGEIDVVVCDSTVADGYVATNPDKYEIAFVDNKEPEEFGIALGKGNEALLNAINEAVKQLTDEGYFDTLNAYWFGNGDN